MLKSEKYFNSMANELGANWVKVITMGNAYNGLDILHEANMMPIFAIDNLFNSYI